MFCTRYFGDRYFAPRYFPKVGGTPTFIPAWALGSNRTVGFGIQPR